MSGSRSLRGLDGPSTFRRILQVPETGVDNALRPVCDGEGDETPLELSRDTGRFTGGPLQIGSGSAALTAAWSAGHRNIRLAEGSTYTLTQTLSATNQRVSITGRATIIQAANLPLFDIRGTWEAEQTITEFVDVTGVVVDPEGDGGDVSMPLIAARVANAGLYSVGDRVKVVDDQALAEERATWLQGEWAIVRAVDTINGLVTFSSRLRLPFNVSNNARMARISQQASFLVGEDVTLATTLPADTPSPAQLLSVDGVYRPIVVCATNRSNAAPYGFYGCAEGQVSIRYGFSQDSVVVILSSCFNFDVDGITSGPCRHVVMPIISSAPSGSTYSTRGYSTSHRVRGCIVAGSAITPFDTHHGTENVMFVSNATHGCGGAVQLRGRNHTVDGHVSFRDGRGFSVFVQSGSAFVNTRSRNNTIRNFRCIEPTSGELGRVRVNSFDTVLQSLYYRGPSVATTITSAVLWFEEAATCEDFEFIVTPTTTFGTGLCVLRFGGLDGMAATFRNGRISIQCVYGRALFRTTAATNRLTFENVDIDCLSGADGLTSIFNGTLAAGSRIGNITISSMAPGGTFFTNYTYDTLRPFLTGPIKRMDTGETWAPDYRIDATGAMFLPVPEVETGLPTNALYFSGSTLKRASALEAVFARFDTLGVPASSALRNVMLTRWDQLLAAGIASRLACLYVFANTNATQAAVDWITPAEGVTLVQPGTAITHAKGSGFGFNGVDNYVRLPRQLSTYAPYSLNSAAAYVDVASGTTNGVVVGLESGGGSTRLRLRPTDGSVMGGGLNNSSLTPVGSNSTVAGRYLLSRPDGSNINGYRNGSLLGTASQSAFTVGNQSALVTVGQSQGAFVNHTVRVFALGSDLSDVVGTFDSIMAGLVADLAALP